MLIIKDAFPVDQTLVAVLRLSLTCPLTLGTTVPGEADLAAVLLCLTATTLLSSYFHPYPTLDLAAVVTLAREDVKGLLQGSRASGPRGTVGFLRSLSKVLYSALAGFTLTGLWAGRAMVVGSEEIAVGFLLFVIYYHFPSFLDSLLKSGSC